ncbi:methionine adenosyltransferase 2 subunit beta-like [Hydractinia symbiolongicarpus]|uniref:methionine adenosyltransferase 2 subunit beta-like n=1 Tax=Hydractinia symbiolongicarpus TaxID=13093 RepID=UPI00254D73C0|nr:methionine adenosyltransferase 2 subunit beta-like [Hydractinia symbiolongicarpus]
MYAIRGLFRVYVKFNVFLDVAGYIREIFMSKLLIQISRKFNFVKMSGTVKVSHKVPLKLIVTVKQEKTSKDLCFISVTLNIKKMKVLITGASGLLGRAIKTEFEKVSDWKILGLGFTRLDGGLKKVDLQNDEEVIQLIDEFKPDVLIHSAAERRPDFVANHEKETEQLNVKATETLAKHVNKYGGFMLYISTDYVFDGTSPPYKVSDATNPLNKYGMSKLQGERETLLHCKYSGVLRVPILYGPLKYVDESAVTSNQECGKKVLGTKLISKRDCAKCLEKYYIVKVKVGFAKFHTCHVIAITRCLLSILRDTSKPATISNYEQRYPTSTVDIAVVCREIIKYRQNHPSFCGIWQWRSDDKLTKYGMVKVMSEVFNLPVSHVTPNNSPTSGAARPYDCEFDCSELEAIGVSQRTPFREAINACLKPFL